MIRIHSALFFLTITVNEREVVICPEVVTKRQLPGFGGHISLLVEGIGELKQTRGNHGTTVFKQEARHFACFGSGWFRSVNVGLLQWGNPCGDASLCDKWG